MLRANLSAHSEIKSWAYIVHDKDTNPDGTPIEPHIHMVIELCDAYEDVTIGNMIGVPKQYVGKIKQKIKHGKRYYADIGGALSYLTHRNKPEGYQYSDDDVVAMPGYDWQEVRRDSETKRDEEKARKGVLEEIENGNIRRYNLQDYITQEDYIDNKIDYERAFERRAAINQSNPNRKIDVYYICGEAGTGKTTIAKMYCEKCGYSYCLSGSIRDPLQNYDGQDAMILDDLRATSFQPADLIKILDNNSASAASARYHDRWLEVKLLIITTVIPIDVFFAAAGSEEPIAQLKRRCKTMICLTKDTMQMYSYRTATDDYMMIGYGKNPIADIYPANVADDDEVTLKERCEAFGIAYKPEALPSDYVT